MVDEVDGIAGNEDRGDVKVCMGVRSELVAIKIGEVFRCVWGRR